MTGLNPRVSAQDATQHADVHRRRNAIPADQAITNDLMRERGTLRHVAGLGPSMVEFSAVVFFGEAESFDDQLCVPLLQTASVWRVRRGQ